MPPAGVDHGLGWGGGVQRADRRGEFNRSTQQWPPVYQRALYIPASCGGGC